MSDELPLPPLKPPEAGTVITKPPLNAEMLDADGDGSPPGAGGWTPKSQTPYFYAAGAATCGGLAISIPAAGMGTPYQFPCIIAGAVFAAIGLGLGTLKGMQSAGPRKVQ